MTVDNMGSSPTAFLNSLRANLHLVANEPFLSPSPASSATYLPLSNTPTTTTTSTSMSTPTPTTPVPVASRSPSTPDSFPRPTTIVPTTISCHTSAAAPYHPHSLSQPFLHQQPPPTPTPSSNRPPSTISLPKALQSISVAPSLVSNPTTSGPQRRCQYQSFPSSLPSLSHSATLILASCLGLLLSSLVVYSYFLVPPQ